MTIIPEDKMKTYLNYCKNNSVTVACSCGEIVDVTITPYYYDEEENDVYFASLCPKCGELIIIKE